MGRGRGGRGGCSTGISKLVACCMMMLTHEGCGQGAGQQRRMQCWEGRQGSSRHGAMPGRLSGLPQPAANLLPKPGNAAREQTAKEAQVGSHSQWLFHILPASVAASANHAHWLVSPPIPSSCVSVEGPVAGHAALCMMWTPPQLKSAVNGNARQLSLLRSWFGEKA